MRVARRLENEGYNNKGECMNERMNDACAQAKCTTCVDESRASGDAQRVLNRLALIQVLPTVERGFGVFYGVVATLVA